MMIMEFLFYLSLKELCTIKGCIEWIGEVQIIEIHPQTESPRKIGHIRVSDRIPKIIAGHVRLPALTYLGSSLSSG
jgi:hypothetical protein